MARETGFMSVVELPGSNYKNLRAAQRSAVNDIAVDLAGTMRGLLASGWLVMVDNAIIPNPERKL